MNCYCGSKQTFDECCNARIVGTMPALTPEQLMRSRYSAYASKNAKYIFDTYASSSRQSQSLTDIEQWATNTTWLSLVVHYGSHIQRSQFNAKIELPTVHFTATYMEGSHFFQMTEISNFILEDENWRYLDGKVSDHQELTAPKRNESCLCGSGRKFKRCCALKL